MLNYVKDITYIKKVLPFSSEYFKLEIHENKNILKFIDRNCTKAFDKIEIQDDIVIDYLDNFFRIIDSWKNKYVNNNILDGIEWQLQVVYKNGEKSSFFGKNDFPANFGSLDTINQQIIEKAMGEFL